MHTWTQLILSSSHGAEVSERAKHEMSAYFADLVGLRSDSTGEDVASLLGAAVGRDEITLEEAVGLAVLLQIGGEAVTNNSGQMFHLLLTRPELAQRLRSEPEIRPRAIDELLRWIPHRNAVGLSRIVLEDVAVRGCGCGRGDAVYVSYLAANRDPEVFPRPGHDRLRAQPQPARVLRLRPALLPRRHAGPAGVRAARRHGPGPGAGAEARGAAEDVPLKKGALIRGPRGPAGDLVSGLAAVSEGLLVPPGHGRVVQAPPST